MSKVNDTKIMDSYCDTHNCMDCKIEEELKNILYLPCDKLWDLREELVDKVINCAFDYLYGARIEVDQRDMERYIRKMVNYGEQLKEQKNGKNNISNV